MRSIRESNFKGRFTTVLVQEQVKLLKKKLPSLGQALNSNKLLKQIISFSCKDCFPLHALACGTIITCVYIRLLSVCVQN